MLDKNKLMKVFVTTGCGNIIQGGGDAVNNNFIELVLPHLDDYYILVDSKGCRLGRYLRT